MSVCLCDVHLDDATCRFVLMSRIDSGCFDTPTRSEPVERFGVAVAPDLWRSRHHTKGREGDEMNFYVTTELRRPSFGDQYIARDGNDDWLIWDARPELCDGYENGVPVRLPRLVITSIVAADAVTREGRGGESSVPVSADSLCTSAATPGDDIAGVVRRLVIDEHHHVVVDPVTNEETSQAVPLLRMILRAVTRRCESCGAIDAEGNELITDDEGSVFCEDCYQP